MAKDSDKPKTGASAAAPAQTPAAQPATPEPAKRTRTSVSKEQKLAYFITGLVAILTSKAVAAVLTEEQRAKVTKAQTQAQAIGGGDPLKPVTDRIVAIQGELQAVNYSKDPEKAVAQVLELSKELDRQIKRKKQIEEMIGA